jgi:ABC-2 type transport system permease protein
MPVWLKIIAKGNPLTYMVDRLRTMMLNPAPIDTNLTADFFIIVLVTTALLAIAAKQYPQLAL